MASVQPGGDDYRHSMIKLPDHPGLKGGGGGGTFDPMEPRVAALEKRFDRLEGQLDKLTEKVADLRVDMATIKERVSHLPTKGWAVGAIVTLVGIMSALIAFAPKLQALVNH